MTEYWISVGDLGPTLLGAAQALLTLGRASDNDVVVEDASISRSHARLHWRQGQAILEDLDSLNGCTVNGLPLTAPAVVDPTDEIRLGLVPLRLLERFGTIPMAGEEIEILPDPSVAIQADQLRDLDVPSQDPERLAQDQGLFQELSLEMTGRVGLKDFLRDLLAGLFERVDPSRGAILLLDEEGRLQQIVGHSAQVGNVQIKLSRTMVKAALERGEALLVNNPIQDDHLSKSSSLVLSGIRSIITVPLEYEGDILGLIYLDAGPIRGAFTEGDLAFTATLGRLASAKIRTGRLEEALASRRADEREMALAQTVQQRFLTPQRAVRDPRYSLYASLRPARDVGGGFFDHFVKDDRLCFCTGDVSGRGLQAALVMALARTLFRAHAAQMDSPAEVLAALNNRLLEETEADTCATVFCGFLDLRGGRLSFSNAGEERPLILTPGKAIQTLHTRMGPALGLVRDVQYPLQFATLDPGDALFCFTNGVPEAANRSGQPLTHDRVRQALEGCRREEPVLIVKTVLDAVDRHAGDTPQADDLTLMVIRFKGAKG
jgi:phosphoserine phosphatase RsbU/P